MIQAATPTAKSSIVSVNLTDVRNEAGPPAMTRFSAFLAHQSATKTQTSGSSDGPEETAGRTAIALSGKVTGKAGGKMLPDGLPLHSSREMFSSIMKESEDSLSSEGLELAGDETRKEEGMAPLPPLGITVVPHFTIPAAIVPPATTPSSPGEFNGRQRSAGQPALDNFAMAAVAARYTAKGRDTGPAVSVKSHIPGGTAIGMNLLFKGTSDPSRQVSVNVLRSGVTITGSNSPFTIPQPALTGEKPTALSASAGNAPSVTTPPVVTPPANISPLPGVTIDELAQTFAPDGKAAVAISSPDRSDSSSDPLRMNSTGTKAAESQPVTPQQKSDAFQPAADHIGVSDSEPLMPGTAKLQPMMALRDAQPLTPDVSNQQFARSASTVQSGPQDFNALIDRLVEARDAASPQTFKTSVTHGEFGKISLNFHQDDGNLHVSMKSLDPGFATAVHAASVARQTMGSGETGSNSETNSPRQDGTAQQQGGTANAQSQSHSSSSSQPNSQGAVRQNMRGMAGEHPFSDTAAPDHSGKKHDSRSGIYV